MSPLTTIAPMAYLIFWCKYAVSYKTKIFFNEEIRQG